MDTLRRDTPALREDNRCRTQAIVALLITLMISIWSIGCTSTSRGPDLLRVSSTDYTRAFDAAVEAARRDGLAATLRDRRGGVIETQPRMAGSMLEPWRTDNATLTQALENTVAYQRRRARFEFVPADMQSSQQPALDLTLTGPDVINARDVPLDLTTLDGDLELRVWVYLERATLPGMRRSTWTRSKTTQTNLVYPEGQAVSRRGQTILWTTIARDPEYERRLLAAVLAIMQQHPAESAADSPPFTQPLATNSQPRNPEEHHAAGM